MPFLEAIASLQAKRPQLIPNGANFKFEEYLRAFSISGISKIDTLVAYQNALEKALAKGQSFSQFVKANPQLLETINKKRLERIFKYNLIYANTRGKLMRYESAPPIVGSSNGDGWYYVFHSRHDSAARHLAYDNVCLPRKHPFWQTHTPPLDWGCRCELQMWSERQIKNKGISLTKNIPQEGGTEAGGFQRDNYKFLANFFKNKLATYANNPKATSLLKGVLQNIATKKARFKSLLRLSKNKTEAIPFGLLDTIPITLKAKTLKANPANDLFDFYLAREVLDSPLLLATHKDTRKLVGQKLGRFYELEIQGGELTGLEHFKEAPPLKSGFEIKKLDFDELAKRAPAEKPYPFTQRVLNTIKSALALLTLDDRQDLHVLDSPNYKQGRSYYTKAPSIEEVRGWIKESLKIDLDKKGKWDKHGIISHPDFEGIVMPFFDKSKAPVKVYKSKLHFNKKGFHIVPVDKD
ncbi:polymorphic toxin type 50 domain-containing protein [Helicobacter suis]|uniref:polymorphic toxin type 50 domain-containing protein n=1 Tax=Helicobacter suis TaxID=104628 RepID=UPI0013D6994A|nr:polymorphic toxin type 50 domain-containing protein [Helicobacter suis]